MNFDKQLSRWMRVYREKNILQIYIFSYFKFYITHGLCFSFVSLVVICFEQCIMYYVVNQLRRIKGFYFFYFFLSIRKIVTLQTNCFIFYK